jgi:hypothetical protein
MMMSGGDDPILTQDPVAGLTAVESTQTGGQTNNTPENPATNDGNPPENDTANNGTNPGTDGEAAQNDPPVEQPERQTVNAAAISAEISSLQDQLIEGADLTTVAARFAEIYEVGGMPDSLRLRVARAAAVEFEFASRNVEACRWYQNVINIEPSEATRLAGPMGNLGCGSN